MIGATLNGEDVLGIMPTGTGSPPAIRCRHRPSNQEEMLAVSGVGEAKLAKYREVFLKVIQGGKIARNAKIFGITLAFSVKWCYDGKEIDRARM